jgi:hypothetical protein
LGRDQNELRCGRRELVSREPGTGKGRELVSREPGTGNREGKGTEPGRKGREGNREPGMSNRIESNGAWFIAGRRNEEGDDTAQRLLS